MHNMESLVRLTLARARIDFSDVATVEHATQVLSLFKAAQIDVYPHHEINQATSSTSNAATSQFNLTTMFNASLKKKEVEIGKLSKPKQMKELMRVLQEKAEDFGSNVFTMPKLLEIAVEVGIKDYYEIINKLNYDGFLLKTPNGYKLVKDSL
jgi:DNA replicative helicase MCM subunit Mcm2 (Cdc46/Mcm family)